MQFVCSSKAERDVIRHSAGFASIQKEEKGEEKKGVEKQYFLKTQKRCRINRLRLPVLSCRTNVHLPKQRLNEQSAGAKGPPVHYLEPRELLYPVNESDNSSPHRNPDLTDSKKWFVNYQTLGKQDALQVRYISRPRDTSNTLPADPTPAGLSRQ